VKLRFETDINQSLQEIKSRFNLDLFIALKPPLIQLSVNRFDGCSPGHEIHLDIKTLGLKQKWISLITEEVQSDNEWSFVDEGKVMPWPLASWRHHHRVISSGAKSSKIIDDITFSCVYPWMNLFMFPALWPTFAIRPSRYRKFFRGA
jgi:ligand-binding SRPBCC domain-containing protein